MAAYRLFIQEPPAALSGQKRKFKLRQYRIVMTQDIGLNEAH